MPLVVVRGSPLVDAWIPPVARLASVRAAGEEDVRHRRTVQIVSHELKMARKALGYLHVERSVAAASRVLHQAHDPHRHACVRGVRSRGIRRRGRAALSLSRTYKPARHVDVEHAKLFAAEVVCRVQIAQWYKAKFGRYSPAEEARLKAAGK